MYVANFAQVGANIQKELDARKLTQKYLADRLSISKQIVNKIIKGSKTINVVELSKIASILGVSTETLLSENIENQHKEKVCFMGDFNDPITRDNVNKICTAIDEIRLLEELMDD